MGLIPGQATNQGATTRCGKKKKRKERKLRRETNTQKIIIPFSYTLLTVTKEFFLVSTAQLFGVNLVPLSCSDRTVAYFEHQQAVAKCAAQPRAEACLYSCDLGKNLTSQ